jgi:hypothetical protein
MVIEKEVKGAKSDIDTLIDPASSSLLVPCINECQAHNTLP